MNLAELETKTTVSFEEGLPADNFLLNNRPADPHELQRVSQFLDIVRSMSGSNTFARVTSENNFPAASGIASSASAFAALALAASSALGLSLTENELSRLARRGSGSASRSIPTGFAEWLPGQTDDSSYSISIARPEYWDLVDVIAIVDSHPKHLGSTDGHRIAITSPLQSARLVDTPRRLDICRKAILEKDFPSLVEIIEQDCLLMHAVMMTSQPSLRYWKPSTLSLIEKVVQWRLNGLPVAYTIDAGPNLHLITTSTIVEELRAELHRVPEVVNLFITHPGGSATIIADM